MDVNICRICVKESSKVNIFETICSSDVVANLIIDLADVDCASDDQMPNGICENCLVELERAHTFRKQIRASDAKLRDLVENLMGGAESFDGDEIEIVVKQDDEDALEAVDVKYSLSIQPMKSASFNQAKASNASEPEIYFESVKEHYSEDDGSQDAEAMEEEMIEENDESVDDSSEIVPEWVLRKKQHMLRAAKSSSAANNKDPKTCCCSCEKTFDNEEEVIAHARRDHKVMATDVTDESEVDVSSDRKNAKCKVCLKEFRSLTALRAHRLRFTAMKKCPECGTLVAKKRFSVHLRTHDANPVECDICGLQLKSERMLGPHKRSHEINGHFKCDECSKEFINEMAYQRHVNHHRYRKKPFRFSCEQCNKGFRSPGQLRNHMRIHTGEKPYACEHCDLTFTHKTDHRRHVWTHTGSPYVCKGCGKDFQRPSHLRQHELACRKNELQNIEQHTEILYYECGDCSEQFQTETAFAEHIANHE